MMKLVRTGKNVVFFATSVIFVFFSLIMRKDLLEMSKMIVVIKFRGKLPHFSSHVSLTTCAQIFFVN